MMEGTSGNRTQGGKAAVPAFGDAPSQPRVDIHSSWKKDTAVENADSQTPAIITSDNTVQTVELADAEAQTENDEDDMDRCQFIEEGDEGRAAPVAGFLKRVEDLVIRQLEFNARSTAFDGFEAGSQGARESKITHTLRNLGLAAELQAVSAAFNKTGSVVAVAYGQADRQEWWTTSSHICTWNLDGVRCNPNKPDKAMELESCGTCLCYHPDDIALLAAGMLNGEVVVLDTSQDEGQELMCVSPFVADSHSEPVSDICWLRHTEDKSQLATVSGDGSVILWLYHHTGSLTLTRRISINTLDIPPYLRPRDSGGQQVELGVTCIQAAPAIDEWHAVLGTEIGCVCRVPLRSRTNTGYDTTALGGAIEMAYRPHQGPVHGVALSPHFENIFASCSTDGQLHLYHKLQSHPLVTLDPSKSALLSAVFHPTRPALLFAASSEGAIVAYDLLKSTTKPVQELNARDADSDSGPRGRGASTTIRKLAINARRPGTLAAACDDGTVRVWSLGAQLREAVPGEKQRMARLLDDLFSTA